MLNPYKSQGIYNINPYILKYCLSSLGMPLCLLFQKSLDLGMVPLLWNQANITPAHKSGCKITLTNYRGISLTSVLCKTMERIISSHIRAHLYKFNIISKSQHGFSPSLSTVTNLLEFKDMVTNALNRGVGFDVVYLDFEKAFDRVPHQRLLLKLKCIGINGTLLNWCTSFLNNRKHCYG